MAEIMQDKEADIIIICHYSAGVSTTIEAYDLGALRLMPTKAII